MLSGSMNGNDASLQDGLIDRVNMASHMTISFYCEHGHKTSHAFAAEALDKVPIEWTCAKCGEPASIDKENIPKKKRRGRMFKSHLQYVLERRNFEEGQELLNERVDIINGKSH
jgi:hypothetical protein